MMQESGTVPIVIGEQSRTGTSLRRFNIQELTTSSHLIQPIHAKVVGRAAQARHHIEQTMQYAFQTNGNIELFPARLEAACQEPRLRRERKLAAAILQAVLKLQSHGRTHQAALQAVVVIVRQEQHKDVTHDLEFASRQSRHAGLTTVGDPASILLTILLHQQK